MKAVPSFSFEVDVKDMLQEQILLDWTLIDVNFENLCNQAFDAILFASSITD